MDIVEVFKAVGDETRIRILNLLRQESLCVCDLEKTLNISQSNVSRHLSTLRRADLVINEKKAQWVYYSLDSSTISQHPFLTDLLVELDKLPQCRKDLSRLKKYRELGGDCTHDVKLEGE